MDQPGLVADPARGQLKRENVYTVCMVIINSRLSINTGYGSIVNPARGQLDRENEFSPVPVRASEFGIIRIGVGGVPNNRPRVRRHFQHTHFMPIVFKGCGEERRTSIGW